MNELQQLIKEQMRAKGLSYRDVQEASRDPATGTVRISKSRVQQLAEKPLTRVLKVEMVEGLAAGLGTDPVQVWTAVAAAAGEAGLQYLYRQLTPDAEVLIASYEELSPDRRAMLLAVLDTLRKMKDAPDE